MKPLRTVQWKFFQQGAGVQKKYDKATKHSGWQSWCKMHSTISRLKNIQSISKRCDKICWYKMLEQHRVTTDTKTIPANLRKPLGRTFVLTSLAWLHDYTPLVRRIVESPPRPSPSPSESRVKCGSSQLKDVDVERIRMLQEASARKAACISLLYVSLYSIMVVFEINGSDMSCSALPMC